MIKITNRLRKNIQPIILIFIGLSFFTIPCAISFADDTPKVVEYEAGFYYTIKKGDTMWGISQKFNDTPWQWPDLWRENAQISNPHWIYPGERIRLFRRNEKDTIASSQAPAPAIVPEVSASPISAKTIEKPEVYYYYSRMDQVGFIRKPAVEPDGVIFKVIDEKKLISAGDTVYIRHPQSEAVTDLTPGSRWTVYRAQKPTDNSDSDQTIGTQHYILGLLEVAQNETQYAMAKVIKSYRHMQIGDFLMPFKQRSPEIAVSDSTKGIRGQFITSEDHTELIGEQVTAFIDKGKEDDIHPGQIYNIYYQDMAPVGSGGETIPLKPVDIGAIFVLHTEKTTSTVLITDAQRKITAKSLIRTP